MCFESFDSLQTTCIPALSLGTRPLVDQHYKVVSHKFVVFLKFRICYTLPCLYLALLDSTQIYYSLPWLYLALLDPSTLYHGSTWLHLTLLHSTTALLSSTGLNLTLLHPAIPLLDSTQLYYMHCTMALLAGLYLTQYYTLPRLYLTLLDSTTLYHGST